MPAAGHDDSAGADPRRSRHAALVFNSETEAPWLFPVRQPDTDTLRLWEVAGTSHSSGAANQKAFPPLFARDGITRAPGRENPNILSHMPAYRAALRHFNTWLRGGPLPPPQARIEFESADPATLGVTIAAPRSAASGFSTSQYRPRIAGGSTSGRPLAQQQFGLAVSKPIHGGVRCRRAQ
jgi:Alpha/beta hydrolase domain